MVARPRAASGPARPLPDLRQAAGAILARLPARSEPLPRAWAVAAEALLVGAIVAGAVALRLPGLMVVPRLTDETSEVLIGLRIARGQAFPLVGANTYIGALFNYLVAGAFLVLGPRPDIGRLVVLAFGALGVVPTYLLGRRLGGGGLRGQAVGLIAALLLACSSTDILVTSRIAFSNALTPFFTTFGLWLLHRAVTERSGRALAGAGLAFGLALQTHASAVASWPGLAVYLWLRRHEIRRGWLALAGALGTLAVGNILAFNVLHLGATLDEVLLRSDRYGGVGTGGLDGWPDRLVALVRGCALALGGRVSEYVEPEALLTAPVLLYAGLALGGLVLLWRRREWLPLLALVSTLLIVSFLNARVEPVVVRARHYAPMLPLGFVLVALAVVGLRDRLARIGTGLLASGLALGLLAALVVLPQVELRSYVAERMTRPDKNNQALLQVVDALAPGPRDERVYLDSQLGLVRLGFGGRVLSSLHYFLILRGQEYDTLDLSLDELPIGRVGVSSRRLVLSPEMVEVAAARYRLVPLRGDPGEGAPLRIFRAYPRATGAGSGR